MWHCYNCLGVVVWCVAQEETTEEVGEQEKLISEDKSKQEVEEKSGQDLQWLEAKIGQQSGSVESKQPWLYALPSPPLSLPLLSNYPSNQQMPLAPTTSHPHPHPHPLHLPDPHASYHIPSQATRGTRQGSIYPCMLRQDALVGLWMFVEGNVTSRSLPTIQSRMLDLRSGVAVQSWCPSRPEQSTNIYTACVSFLKLDRTTDQKL